MIGSYHECKICPKFELCQKCYSARELFHPDHDFDTKGVELPESEADGSNRESESGSHHERSGSSDHESDQASDSSDSSE